MSPALTTFLFEAANFLVLAGVLGWLFFQPVRQALAERAAKFEADSKEAAEKLAAANAAEQQMDETRDKLQSEMDELRKRELEAAHAKASQIIEEAREAAERERELGRRQAASLSESKRATLGEVAGAAAADTVGRLLEQIGGPDLHSALIESACRQLAAMQIDTTAPVKVESNEPLSQDQATKLRHALGDGADRAEFRTVENLGAGIRILTDRGLIDASVAGLTQFARQSLVKEMKRRANNHNPLQGTNHD